jgi:hypothetical protein
MLQVILLLLLYKSSMLPVISNGKMLLSSLFSLPPLKPKKTVNRPGIGLKSKDLRAEWKGEGVGCATLQAGF